MRELSETFKKELKSGVLEPVLNLVKLDSTLCLEIRENYINIYYRGGNILRIKEKNNVFIPEFDREYLDKDKTKVPEDLPETIEFVESVNRWLGSIPFIKHEMDLWFGKNPKNEREFQQVMVRENNFGNAAKSTDYFIIDIEYDNREGARFDLVAVHWPSSSSERKNNRNLRLAFIEMKYSDSALSQKAGLEDHVNKMSKFLENQGNLRDIKEEMKKVFNQKLELELINNQKQIESFSDNKPEYILALANQDPDSKILIRELEKLTNFYQNMEVKVAVSNFMGYGLYKESIYGLNDFKEIFKKQICHEADHTSRR